MEMPLLTAKHWMMAFTVYMKWLFPASINRKPGRKKITMAGSGWRGVFQWIVELYFLDLAEGRMVIG